MEVIMKFTPIYDEAVYEYICYVKEKKVATVSCCMNTQKVCINSLPSECELKIYCKRKKDIFSIPKRWKQIDYVECVSLQLMIQIHRKAEIQITTCSKIYSYKGEHIYRMVLHAVYSNLKVHKTHSVIPWTDNERKTFLIRNLNARICVPALLAVCMPIEMIYALRKWGKSVAMNGMTGTDQFFLAIGMEAVLIVFMIIRIHKFMRLSHMMDEKD